MNVFWRQKPLAAPQARALSLILNAHEQCAMRDNISTVTLRNAAIGSGSYTNAVAAALLTVGAVHAPLIQAYSFIAQFNPDEVGEFARHIEMGGLVPGWGSDFAKNGPDELLKPIADCIAEFFPLIDAKIQRITDELHARSKMVWPNLACYTAAVGMAIEIPLPILPWLMIQGRLAFWTRDYVNTLVAHNAPKKKKGVLV